MPWPYSSCGAGADCGSVDFCALLGIETGCCEYSSPPRAATASAALAAEENHFFGYDLG